MESGKEMSGKAMEFKYGQTGLNIKVNGSITKQRAKASSRTSTATSTMVSGNKTKPQEKEFTFTTMGQDTKANG